MDIQELIDYLYDFHVSADISIESLAQDIYSMFSNKESKKFRKSIKNLFTRFVLYDIMYIQS